MHKRKLFILSLFMCLLCVILLCGCSGAEAQKSSSTKEITDVYGRSVAIPNTVEKVATVGSAARYVVYAGGQEGVSKLVAVTAKETEQSSQRPYTVAYAEDFSKLPQTSNGNHLLETSVDAEALLALEPDVIISSRSAAECDDLQQDLQIPVVGISYQDQIFSDDVFSSIRVVGEVLGTQQHAEEVIASLSQWQEDLATRAAQADDTQTATAYAGGINYKGAKGVTGTYCHYAPFEAANANNVADQLGLEAGAVDITLEQLGAWNPQYMFLSGDNISLLKKEYAENQAFFESLDAFAKGQVFAACNFNMNGTNLELALCDAYFMGATLYPAAYADLDISQQFNDICQCLLGVSFDSLGIGQEYFGTLDLAS